MSRRVRLPIAAALLVGLCGQAPHQSGLEAVQLASTGAGGATITAYLRRPPGVAKAPAVVMLHGCGGLLNARGKLMVREQDWSDRLVAAGYVVALPDSFNPRGFRQVCTLKASERTVRAFDRAEDAAAAIAWLAAQPFVDAERIALIGWSHGGSTTLWTVSGREPAAARLKTAIAFYPGCRPMSVSRTWIARAPLTIMMGAEDDWTPPEPCRALKAAHPSIRYVEFPGAVHGFDAPNSPLRVRTDIGISQKGDGRAKVGTHPEARAAAIEEVARILAAAFK
jgi:dienelactone hydrolase